MLEYKDGRKLEFYCANEKKGWRDIGLMCTAAFCVAFNIALMGVIVGFLDGMVWWLVALLPIIVSYVLFILARNCFYRAYMKWQIGKEGIWIKYPLEQYKLIPWYDFEDLCICYAYPFRLGRLYEQGFKMIVLARRGAKKDHSGRWSVFNPWYFMDTLSFDYEEELFRELQDNCPYPFVDRRMEPEYKLE